MTTPPENHPTTDPNSSHPDSKIISTPKTSLLGDTLKLAFGTGTGQVISALSILFITRLYSAESFGLFGIYVSISGILTIIACMRYELSINLPSTDNEGANQLAVSLLFSITLSLILVPIIWLTGNVFTRFLNAPKLLPYLWFLPVSLFLGGTSLALNYWNTRTYKFGRLSILTITNMLVTAVAQIVLGLRPGAGEGELIIGSLVGTITAVGLLAFRVWKDDHKLFMSSIRWTSIRDGIQRYKKFPLYNTGASFLNNLSWQLPTFMLTYYFSPTISGYYTLGNRVLRLPMSLIGGAIGQAQYPRLAEAKEAGDLSLLVEQTLKRLVAYSMFPLLILSMVGVEAFVIIFGSKWVEAGVYAQILSIWTLFWFISSPLSNVFSIMEKQEQSLRINIFVFLSRLLALWIGGVSGQPRIAVILFAVSGVLVYGYVNVQIMHISGVPIKKVLGILWKYFRLFIPAGAALGVMKYFSVQGWIQLVVASIATISYYCYVVLTDEQAMRVLSKPIQKIKRAIRTDQK